MTLRYATGMTDVAAVDEKVPAPEEREMPPCPDPDCDCERILRMAHEALDDPRED